MHLGHKWESTRLRIMLARRYLSVPPGGTPGTQEVNSGVSGSTNCVCLAQGGGSHLRVPKMRSAQAAVCSYGRAGSEA